MINTAKLRNWYWKFKSCCRNIKSSIWGKGHVISRKRSDLQHPYFIRLGTSDENVEEDIFEDYFPDFGFIPRTIIDAGANIGLRSIQFANKFRDAKIIAIEPDRSNFELLMRNTSVYPQITCLHGGLWNKETYLQITNPTGESWAFTVEEVPPDDPRTQTEAGQLVKSFSISGLMSTFQWTEIDLLKVDIEGSEKELFESNAEMWMNSVKAYMIEFHDRMKKGCAQSFFKALYETDKEYRLAMNGENIIISPEFRKP